MTRLWEYVAEPEPDFGRSHFKTRLWAKSTLKNKQFSEPTEGFETSFSGRELNGLVRLTHLAFVDVAPRHQPKGDADVRLPWGRYWLVGHFDEMRFM